MGANRATSYAGQILRVDLSRRHCRVEPLDLGLARRYLGSRGLGTRILYDELDPGVDPLSPQNKLLFATGPLTGTVAPTGGRYTVVTKGALTNAVSASNAGGYFGAEMKFAGYDLLVFEGQASAPVYLWVEDDRVEIRDASHLWGTTTHECEDRLREETDGQAKISSIGPAGESLVRFACVINDKHRAAGRSGVGAVMGSKRLKAVAVRGNRAVSVADPRRFLEAVALQFGGIRKHPATAVNFPTYGTGAMMHLMNENGMLPTRNFQAGTFEGAGNLSGETIHDTILLRNKACFSCPIGCGRVTEIAAGPYKGAGEGPEYETAFGLGPACGVADLAAVTQAGYLCNMFGMDTISAGATLGCAMELFQRGYLSAREVGFELRFGDPDLMLKLIEMTARRQGFGNALAEGSLRLAGSCGHPELFMGVKGQDFPAYDPRGSQAMGLGYATSNRGACHVRGYPIHAEVLGHAPRRYDRHSTEGKAELEKEIQDFSALLDSAGVCKFVEAPLDKESFAGLLAAATGFPYDLRETLLLGERVWNLERLFNLRAGFTRADDTLPPRLLQEPFPQGPNQGVTVHLEEMLEEYYRIRGWDAEGRPTPQKMEELGLVAGPVAV